MPFEFETPWIHIVKPAVYFGETVSINVIYQVSILTNFQIDLTVSPACSQCLQSDRDFTCFPE